MRNIITTLLLSICFTISAQTNTEARDPMYQTEAESTLTYNNSTILLSKYKTDKILEYTLTFKVRTENCEQSQKGIHLSLSNGEILNFDTIKLVCETKNDKSQTLKGSIILTPDLFDKLCKTEIKDVKIGTIKFPVIFEEKGVNSTIFLKNL